MSEAKKRNPDALVLLDADGQHNPEEIPNIIKPIFDGYDVVIGSRSQRMGNVPRYRRVGQKIILLSTKFLSKEPISDSECGFRVFSNNAISKLELREKGMAVSAETIAEAAGKELKVAEVPVTVTYSEDSSTLNPLAHGFGVLARVMVMISERRPLFFFGLGGVIACIIGLMAGVRVLQILGTTGALPIGTLLASVLFLLVGIFSIFTGIILNVLAKRRD